MIRRLYLQLYLALLAATVICLLAVGGAFRLLGDPIGTPAERLRVASGVVVESLNDVPDQRLPHRLGALGDELSMDLIVWDADGTVLAEASHRPTTPAPLPALPPIPDVPPNPMIQPRAAGPAWVAERGGLELVVPLGTAGRQIGLRNRHHLRGRRSLSFPAGLVILALVMAAGSYPVARRLAKRLEAVASGVERWGKGDLGHRVPVEGRDEVATLAATFNQAAGQIDTLVAQQRQMLANASHELRSPLARLRMALELLSEEPRPEQRAQLIEDSRHDVVELDALIEELLLMARADGRTPRRPFESVDLRSLIDSEAARIGGAAVEGTATLSGDPLLLRHLIRNLLENAQRYGRGQGIKALLATTNESVILAVEDGGPGIPVEERERIFAPFYRVTGSGRDGVGLGLALVRQVAHYHGGEAHALASPAGGSRFEVILPRQGPTAARGDASARA
jgi:two-component system OmpR family sensor kinase